MEEEETPGKGKKVKGFWVKFAGSEVDDFYPSRGGGRIQSRTTRSAVSMCPLMRSFEPLLQPLLRSRRRRRPMLPPLRPPPLASRTRRT